MVGKLLPALLDALAAGLLLSLRVLLLRVLLRGGGGGVDGSEAAQGLINTIIEDRDRT